MSQSLGCKMEIQRGLHHQPFCADASQIPWSAPYVHAEPLHSHTRLSGAGQDFGFRAQRLQIQVFRRSADQFQYTYFTLPCNVDAMSSTHRRLERQAPRSRPRAPRFHQRASPRRSLSFLYILGGCSRKQPLCAKSQLQLMALTAA